MGKTTAESISCENASYSARLPKVHYRALFSLSVVSDHLNETKVKLLNQSKWECLRLIRLYLRRCFSVFWGQFEQKEEFYCVLKLPKVMKW